jgi:hypothetical protein
MKIEDIKCPICGKLLAKKQSGVIIPSIYLYCKVCKTEIEYKEPKSQN